jgi:transcriptional regulator GlxA family with amidase domain
MKIGLVMYTGAMPSGLYAFADILEGVNKVKGERIFDFYWIFADKNSVDQVMTTTMSDYPQTDLHDESMDALLIAGFWSETTEKISNMLELQKDWIKDLKKIHAKTPVFGFCSSVCMLADSGLLDNQLATSTWWLASFLQDNYEHVNWNFSQNLIANTHNITATGWLGSVRIAQQVIMDHCDLDTYTSVADLLLIQEPVKVCEAFKDLQWVNFEDAIIKKVYTWITRTPAQEISIKTLAEYLNLTDKTISRRIKGIVSMQPAKFMRQLKLQQAAVQLIKSHKTIAQISDELGYSNDASFRRSFLAETKMTPSDFRGSQNQ